MINEEYKPVQVPKAAHKKLKDYCKENGYKIGKFLEILIEKNCVLQDKKRVLKVD